MTARVLRRRAATAVALVAVLVLAAVVLIPRREQVLDALAGLDPRLVGLSVALTIAGVALTAQTWSTWLASVAPHLPTGVSHRLFFVTQAAKYLPGGLWPVAAQAAVSRRFRIPVEAMVAASSLFMLTHLVSGAAVGVGLLGRSGGPAVATTSLVVALGGLVLLTPPGMDKLLRLVRRVRPRLAVVTPGWGTVGRALAWMALAWLCYGGALWSLALATGGTTVGPLTSTGTFATAWSLGFLALALPAGVGVRETVIVAALVTGGMAEGSAIAVAVVSRAAFTVVDLCLAAGSVRVLDRLAPPVDVPTDVHVPMDGQEEEPDSAERR